MRRVRAAMKAEPRPLLRIMERRVLGRHPPDHSRFSSARMHFDGDLQETLERVKPRAIEVRVQP